MASQPQYLVVDYKPPSQNVISKGLQTDQVGEQQQQQEQEISYKIDNLLPKQNQKQKLIEQNIKLKTQIYQLAIQLDEILSKDKMKKKKYGLVLNPGEDEDQNVRAKRLQLKKQQLQIVEAKNRIFELKRQLDSVFNNQIVQQRQDRLKVVKRKLEELEQEKDGLIKIKKSQAKAIKNMKNEEEFKEKTEKIHKQVMRIKQETQKLMEKALQARKDEINCHEKYVNKLQKRKQLETKLVAVAKGMKDKQKGKGPIVTPQHYQQQNSINNSKDTISNEMIQELQQQIKKLQMEKREGEKVWQDKIRLIENELQMKRQQEQKKLLILRQKEKQLKLNEIRIKQLRKLVKQNIIQQNTKKVEDVDMSQYRHRRNIRYIDK